MICNNYVTYLSIKHCLIKMFQTFQRYFIIFKVLKPQIGLEKYEESQLIIFTLISVPWQSQARLDILEHWPAQLSHDHFSGGADTYYWSPELALGREGSSAGRDGDWTWSCSSWLENMTRGMRNGNLNSFQIKWMTLSIKIPLHICSCSIYFVRGKFSLWNPLLWNNLKIVLW